MSEPQQPTAAERRVSAQESCARIAAELGNLLQCLAPSDEVRGHFKVAYVEFLKGVRGLIDARIEQLSADRRRGTSVPIE